MAGDGLAVLLFRPHSFSVYRGSDTLEAGSAVRIAGVGYGLVWAGSGQLTPMSAQAALERTGVEMDRPHLLMFGGEGAILPGDMVGCGGRWFEVMRPVEVWDAVAQVACHTVVLSELLGEAVEAAEEF